MLAVTSFEIMNSVFNITDVNNSFSIAKLGHWNSENGKELINKLNKWLDLRYENKIKFHVGEVRKRGNEIKMGDREYKWSDLDSRKNEITKKLKNKKKRSWRPGC